MCVVSTEAGWIGQGVMCTGRRCCAVGIRSGSGVKFLVGETSGLWRSAVVYSVGPDIWWVVGEWWEWWASGCLPILEGLSYCRECLGAVGPSLSYFSQGVLCILWCFHFGYNCIPWGL